MQETLKLWLKAHGPQLADRLEAQREPICDVVAARLETVFPSLGCDLLRAGTATFTQNVYQASAYGFHRLLQVALRFQTMSVIEGEYRWAWGILPRYGVTQNHLRAQMRWYFKAARIAVALDAADQTFVDALEVLIADVIARVTAEECPIAHASRPAPIRA
ncbi:MAG TPA: hypothetical protein VF909_17390 [Roseiflexaceae bacterium]